MPPHWYGLPVWVTAAASAPTPCELGNGIMADPDAEAESALPVPLPVSDQTGPARINVATVARSNPKAIRRKGFLFTCSSLPAARHPGNHPAAPADARLEQRHPEGAAAATPGERTHQAQLNAVRTIHELTAATGVDLRNNSTTADSAAPSGPATMVQQIISM
ncbi:hypothetical protein GCM10023319_09900 [Nocardia iowensis]